jgi:hypothetical protein
MGQWNSRNSFMGECNDRNAGNGTACRFGSTVVPIRPHCGHYIHKLMQCGNSIAPSPLCPIATFLSLILEPLTDRAITPRVSKP